MEQSEFLKYEFIGSFIRYEFILLGKLDSNMFLRVVWFVSKVYISKYSKLMILMSSSLHLDRICNIFLKYTCTVVERLLIIAVIKWRPVWTL